MWTIQIALARIFIVFSAEILSIYKEFWVVWQCGGDKVRSFAQRGIWHQFVVIHFQSSIQNKNNHFLLQNFRFLLIYLHNVIRLRIEVRNAYDEWKQTNETSSERARGANDIIFIFVNEFWTEKEKKKKTFLTSVGLYFVSLDVDNQNCCSRESERRVQKADYDANENQINKKAISLDFFHPIWKWKWNKIALLLNHHSRKRVWLPIWRARKSFF